MSKLKENWPVSQSSIINVYVSTGEKDEEIEFYERLVRVLDQVPKYDVESVLRVF